MLRQSLIALALLLVALSAGWWFNRPLEAPPAAVAQPWLPALQGQAATITAIEVRRPGQPLVRLERREQGWVLPAKADYPADQAAVSALLRALLAAHKVAPRTANPALFAQLELDEKDGAEGQAIRLSLEQAGAVPTALLIGKPGQQGGQLVRRADEQQSWLVDQRVELPATELQWLDRRVSAIPFATVRELTLRYPQGEVLRLFRSSAQEPDLQVRELPKSRQLAFASIANGSAMPFADLQFNEVAPLSQIGFKGKPALRFSLSTFAGATLDGEVFVQAEQPWLVLGKAQGFDAQSLPGTSAWAYRLEPTQYQMLAKKLTDLLTKKP